MEQSRDLSRRISTWRGSTAWDKSLLATPQQLQRLSTLPDRLSAPELEQRVLREDCLALALKNTGQIATILRIPGLPRLHPPCELSIIGQTVPTDAPLSAESTPTCACDDALETRYAHANEVTLPIKGKVERGNGGIWETHESRAAIEQLRIMACFESSDGVHHQTFTVRVESWFLRRSLEPRV